jgi:brefeldin A-inhibited guanine nucleotide-exchange protein
VIEFNRNPKRGMKLFISGGFVNETAEEVARFLRNNPELSKKSIGDYIGESDEFCIKVMHAFVDSLDFSGIDFVGALRNFLQTFRLPGEAQKIDRLMEKFADRYCEQNPNIFAKADTAYTLAFSVIMLNTDLHSSEIKHRMDKAAFLKNNRGIDGDGDLPDEYLGGIFDEIKSNEIILEDEKLQKMIMGWGAGELNEKKRLETYRSEVETMHKKASLLRTGTSARVISAFISASNRELPKTMFSTTAWAIMAAFSLSFEAIDQVGPSKLKEPEVVELCLDGIVGSIKLACWFHLETERDAFVSTLSKMTGLNHFYEIKEKNTNAIVRLIGIASTFNSYLDSAWIEIINSLSQLDKMQAAVLKGDPLMTSELHLQEKRELDLSNAYQELVQTSPKHKNISNFLEEFVAKVQLQESVIQIDRIFTTSVKLSASSIIHFFNAVCAISLEEVGINQNGLEIGTSPPRMYLLQKIVEIAHYNMHRIRFEWTQIWKILQPHFNIVACHSDIRVSNFAVDSLRQLGMKFLERDELGQFSTQHEYLKSFEWIIKHNSNPIIREQILNSLSQMISARAARIKSGWKSIFVTLAQAAQTDGKLALSSFHKAQVIFNRNFDDVVSAGSFVDLVSCLAEYALLNGSGPAHDELVMSSIQMLQSCTKSLLERVHSETEHFEKSFEKHSPSLKVNNISSQPYILPNGCISEEHFYLSWFPILSAFSRVITESDGVLVRTHTMEILFEILKSSGRLFDAPYWKKIARNIVNPIFEDLNDQEINIGRESNSAVLIHGLRLLVSLMTEHFTFFLEKDNQRDNSCRQFLYDSIDRMVEMMTKSDENLTNLGQTCFQQFLVSNGSKFDNATWIWVSSRIEKSFQMTSPIELVQCSIRSERDVKIPEELEIAVKTGVNEWVELNLEDLDFSKTIVKCVTHKELLLTLKDFTALEIQGRGSIISVMPEACRKIMLRNLYFSYAVARMFNSLTGLRQAIHKKGWVSQLPNLIDQETISFSAYMNTLVQIVKISDDENYIKSFSTEIKDLLGRFVLLVEEPERNKQYIKSWSPIVMMNLKQLCDLKHLWQTDGPLKFALPDLYRFTVKIAATENYEVRTITMKFLLEIGEYFLKDIKVQ